MVPILTLPISSSAFQANIILAHIQALSLTRTSQEVLVLFEVLVTQLVLS